MTRQLRLLATALMFLTRLPVARLAYPDAQSLGHSARYFPIVGLTVGAIGAGIFALGALYLTPFLAAMLTVLGLVVVTGAFHEDGLADTADGLGGGLTIERKLEIMKDSRIGSYGAIALVISLLLRVGALVPLDAYQAFVALVVAHTLARTSSLWLMLFLPYVRSGSNKPMADAMSWREGAIGTGFALAICAALAFSPGTIIAFLAAVFTTLLVGWYFKSQLGGITGDTLGAGNQAVEVVVLLVFAVSQSRL